MNLTRIIALKERIAVASEPGTMIRFEPDERDFILECIAVAVGDKRAEAADTLRLRTDVRRLRAMLDWCDKQEPGIKRRAEIATK